MQAQHQRQPSLKPVMLSLQGVGSGSIGGGATPVGKTSSPPSAAPVSGSARAGAALRAPSLHSRQGSHGSAPSPTPSLSLQARKAPGC
jgi:hypothetical protein